eukprot:1281305-Rhodomonas_salina.1
MCIRDRRSWQRSPPSAEQQTRKSEFNDAVRAWRDARTALRLCSRARPGQQKRSDLDLFMFVWIFWVLTTSARTILCSDCFDL